MGKKSRSERNTPAFFFASWESLKDAHTKGILLKIAGKNKKQALSVEHSDQYKAYNR